MFDIWHIYVASFLTIVCNFDWLWAIFGQLHNVYDIDTEKWHEFRLNDTRAYAS